MRSEAITVEEGEALNLLVGLLIIAATQSRRKKKPKPSEQKKALFAAVVLRPRLCFHYLRRITNADSRVSLHLIVLPFLVFCS